MDFDFDPAEFPDRISIARNSRFYTSDGNYFRVFFNGEEMFNCVEFCVSGGWVRNGVPSDNGKMTSLAVQMAQQTPKGTVALLWRYPPSRQMRRKLLRIGS